LLLRKLNLRNFRNYTGQDFNFNPRFNFIHGDNGEGKTNILEAVSFISYGKSFLSSADADCVRFESDDFDVNGVYENEIGNVYNVSAGYNKTLKKKSFLLNNEKVERYSSEIFGKFPVVFFSPHSMSITYGNPSERRKFFDMLIAQTSRFYLDLLKDMVRVLKQKNALLKNQLSSKTYSGNDFTHLLETYNKSLSKYSAEIVFRRLKFLEEFIVYFRESFGFLVPSGDEPWIDYDSELFENGRPMSDEVIPSLDEIIRLHENLMERKTAEEIARGISLVGAHRDDYFFLLRKMNLAGTGKIEFSLKKFASQGEHKTFVIALKLAEYHFLKDKLGNSPLLLLDDLLSELDHGRVLKIVSHLKDYGQIFLTATDLTYDDDLKKFYGIDEISYFKVTSGMVKS